MAVLKQLRQKDSHGRFVRMSGEELAAAIHARGGVGTITGCIQTLRRNIVDRLRKAGVVVGRQDVIEHDQQGYGLRDWIKIRDGDTAACPSDVPPMSLPMSPRMSLRTQEMSPQCPCAMSLQGQS